MGPGYHGALLGIILLAIFATLLGAQDPQADAQAARQHKLAVLNKLKEPDGLHQAAKLNGGSIRTSGYLHAFAHFTTLEALAGSSVMAIVGTPLSSEVKLVNDGRDITTQYKVKVLEPIQGKVQWDDVLTVNLRGGKVVFDDGTTAEQIDDELPRLQIGHRYVIYLDGNEERTLFVPAGGAEGIFELRTDGKVSPFAENMQAAARGDDALEFIDKVRYASRLQKPQ